jgi:hypothetical protein
VADAWETFGSSEMLTALARLSRLRVEAHAARRPDIALQLSRLLVELEAELGALSRRTAAAADKAIRDRLRTTAKRPETSKPHHLIDVIRSEPLPLGGVAVAIVEELDKAINEETGYGPYWRAQEFGSLAVGNRMTGRVLFGRYSGPGHDDAPRAVYGGVPRPPGAEFAYGALSGGDPGYGTIGHELPGRHFLRDGTDEAWVFYRAEVDRLSRGFARRLAAVV